MKQYKSVDLAKFICAILIIILHTGPFSSYSKALTFGFRNIVTVIAVPFFFSTSGFLLFKKLDILSTTEQNKYMIRYLKRIFTMYGIWSAIYFPFVVIRWFRKGFSVQNILEYVRDFFFEGSYSTIWFLPALFVATLIVFLLHKKLSYKKIFVLCCLVYAFTLCGSSYYGLVNKIPALKLVFKCYYTFFDSIKNGVCFGMIFVCIGAMIAEGEEQQRNESSIVKNFVSVMIFALLLAVEEFFIAYFNWNIKGVDTVFFLVPFTYFFLRFVLSIKININDRSCVLMRKYSILMFLCQRIPLSIIDVFMKDTIVATNSFLYFATVLCITFLISFLIIQCSKKIKALRCVY